MKPSLVGSEIASATVPLVSKSQSNRSLKKPRRRVGSVPMISKWTTGCHMLTTRSYRDACPIARALDVIGERWGLLVVRELLLGAQRFSDLQRALPGEVSRRSEPIPENGRAGCSDFPASAFIRHERRRLHLSDASADPTQRAGKLPDLRHDARASRVHSRGW